jgi:hypothetical protein
MKKEITLCDKCGKEKPCKYLFLKRGRRNDGAAALFLKIKSG